MGEETRGLEDGALERGGGAAEGLRVWGLGGGCVVEEGRGGVGREGELTVI